MNITMEQYHDYLSLYDYLGRAAGQEMGAEVMKAAMEKNVVVKQRHISNPSYTGKVMLYPVRFLKEYFDALKQAEYFEESN